MIPQFVTTAGREVASGIAIDMGLVPVGMPVLGPKPPVPLPRNIDTVLAPQLAATRSSLPSPFMSPAATVASRARQEPAAGRSTFLQGSQRYRRTVNDRVTRRPPPCSS